MEDDEDTMKKKPDQAALFKMEILGEHKKAGAITTWKGAGTFTIFIIIVVIIFVLIFNAAATSSKMRKESQESLFQQERTIGRSISGEIMKVYGFADFSTKYVADALGDGTLESKERKVLSQVHETYSSYLIRTMWLNSSDHLEFVVPEDLTLGGDRLEGTGIIERIKEGKPAQYVFKDASLNEAYSMIISPVMVEGKYFGALSFQLDPRKILEQSLGSPDIKRKVIIADEQGMVLFSTDPGLLSLDIMGIFRENVQEISRALNTREETSFLSHSGEDIIVASPIGENVFSWTFFMVSDASAAEAKIKKNLIEIWVFFSLSIAALIILGFLAARNLTGSLKFQVNQKTKEMKMVISELEDTKAAIMNMMEDMVRANEELKQLDEAKSNFLNLVSHELKTPLTAISAHLEVLDDLNESFSGQQLSSLDAVKRNAHQLRILIENILEISRIEAGKFQLNYSQVDIRSLLYEVVGNLDIVAKKQGITLNVTAGRMGKIMADETRLREILNNLVSNAIKFTPKGSVHLKAKKTQTHIQIDVADTGIGIPEQKMRNLFTKFYQVDATLGRKYGGTGLGLSISRQLVELQGGKIWAKSVEGKGSVFSFIIPLKKRREQ